MAGRTVVIVGGGAGGFSAAALLRRRLGREHRVVLVERAERHVFSPSLLWLMVGWRRPEQVTAELAPLERRGITMVRAEALAVDPDRRRVETTAGPLEYDHLVLAPGAELAPAAVPGLREHGHGFYDLEGAVRLRDALCRFPGGRVAVVVSSLPYKCPAAPYEAALLLDDLFRRTGRRAAVTLDVYTPEPLPLPTAGEVLGRAVRALLEERGIGFHPGRSLAAVEVGRLRFADGGEAACDLAVAVPPHRPPALAAASGLAGAGGWLAADPLTLRLAPEGVYALGDAAAIPLPGRYRPDAPLMLPRAGVFAHAQAAVVAENVAAEVEGRPVRQAFDGRGFCFLEVGGGRAGAAQGEFYATPAPRVRLFRPGRLWHLGKVVFERSWLSWLRGGAGGEGLAHLGIRLAASERLWRWF